MSLGDRVFCLHVPDFALESRIKDLEAVIDAAGLETFALLGMSQGGPVAIAFALRHPELVTRLILLGSYTATSVVPGPTASVGGSAMSRHNSW